MRSGILWNVVLLVEYRQQFVNTDPGMLIVEGVVFGRPVRVAILPIAGGWFRLVGEAMGCAILGGAGFGLAQGCVSNVGAGRKAGG
jgi:hypothetical protein